MRATNAAVPEPYTRAVAVFDPKPIAWFRLSDSSEQTGAITTVTTSGTPVHVPSTFGQAARFSRQTPWAYVVPWVSQPAVDGLGQAGFGANNYSVHLRFRQRRLGAHDTTETPAFIMARRPSGLISYAIFLNAFGTGKDRLSYFFGLGTHFLSGPLFDLRDTAWHSLSFYRHADRYEVFFDGVLFSTVWGVRGQPTPTETDLYIGGDTASNPEADVDELVFYRTDGWTEAQRRGIAAAFHRLGPEHMRLVTSESVPVVHEAVPVVSAAPQSTLVVTPRLVTARGLSAIPALSLPLSANYDLLTILNGALTVIPFSTVNGEVLTRVAGAPAWATPAAATGPVWEKYTTSHTALKAAGLTSFIQLFSLPAKGAIHAVAIKHSVAFAGPGITGYTLSLGIAGDLTRYASAFDVLQTPGPTVFQTGSVHAIENFAVTTSIRLAATSTGANLDQSTAGSVDVYVLRSLLP